MPGNRPNPRPAGPPSTLPPIASPRPGDATLPGNRPRSTPRPAAGGLLLALLLVGALFVPAVSAEILINDHLKGFEDTGLNTQLSPAWDYTGGGTNVCNEIWIAEIVEAQNFQYLSIGVDGDGYPSLTDGDYPITYTLGGTTNDGIMYIEKSKNILGQITSTRVTVFFYNWNIGSLTGQQKIHTNPAILYSTGSFGRFDDVGYMPDDSNVMISSATTKIVSPTKYSINYITSMNWENIITVESQDFGGYLVDLERIVNGQSYPSTLIISDATDTETYRQYSPEDYTGFFAESEIAEITIESPLGNYTYNLGATAPGTSATVNVYVRSSQTGALIANAHLSILAAAGDPTELYEVVNATLPGGTGTYTLQPTGTADPYPLYYRANATVPGYSQIIENHSFTLTGPHDVIIEMRPDSGGPTDPENCYLEFYVRDLNANSIPSASIQCNNQIKTTNSAGYAIFEVGKNATYPYKVSKAGYVTIEGTATTGPNPRYIVNVVLGPGTVPTYTPTTGPGETPGGPGATPTPDHRTNEQKGQAVIDMIADNAEGIGALALICLLLGLLKLMVKW